MTVFAVEYEYAQDSTELRNEHRPAHRAFLTEYLEETNVRLLASGPTPVLDGALLIFAAANEVSRHRRRADGVGRRPRPVAYAPGRASDSS